MDSKTIAELREQTGAGILDCKQALEESGGDMEKAAEILRKKGQKVMDKKSGRETKEGLVHAYIHSNGKIGAMVEVNCETDFVARNEEFQEFVHDLAMHIAAASPLYISPEDVPEEKIEKEKDIIKEQMVDEAKPAEVIDKIVEGKINKFFEEVCLLKQPYIKDEDITIEDLLKDKIAKIGENIKIGNFCRFSI